jgi:tryptophanyl-tRNA synthetase
VKIAVTDSGREVVAGPDKPAITNLLTIHSIAAQTSMRDLEARFAGKGYSDLKASLARALLDDPGELSRLLEIGADKARAEARKTLDSVHEKIGFLPRSG